MSVSLIKTSRSAVRYWWLLLFSGLLLIGLGTWVISVPLGAYLTISKVFAVGAVVTGALEIVYTLLGYRAPVGRGWLILSGFIDLFIGVYLLNYPLITMVILPVFVGFWLFLRGVVALAHAWEMRDRGVSDWAYLVIVGLLLLMIAMMILTNLIWGVAYIVIWTGAGLIIAGVFRVYLSLKLRNSGLHVKK